MRRFVIPCLLVLVFVGGHLAPYSSSEKSVSQTVAFEPANFSEMGEIRILGTTSSTDEKVVDWARDRFIEARLPLPPIHVSFHSQSAPCGGAEGGHMIENGTSRVFICVTEAGYSRELKLKRTLLHEFAHAWDDHFLSQRARKEFMALRGLEGWSFEVSYEERGSEHAAETLTWGLIDEPMLFGSLNAVTPWHAQREGYLALTGVEPPHGYVWSLWAASHDIYAHTPDQLDAVQTAWHRSEESGRRAEWIEVRFHRTSDPCGGEVALSKLAGHKLLVQVCPSPNTDLADVLLAELRNN